MTSDITFARPRGHPQHVEVRVTNRINGREATGDIAGNRDLRPAAQTRDKQGAGRQQRHHTTDLEGNQAAQMRRRLRGAQSAWIDPKRLQILKRQVDPVTQALVLANVLAVLKNLQRRADVVGQPPRVAVVHTEELEDGATDRVGRQRAIAEQIAVRRIPVGVLVQPVRFEQIEERLLRQRAGPERGGQGFQRRPGRRPSRPDHLEVGLDRVERGEPVGRSATGGVAGVVDQPHSRVDSGESRPVTPRQEPQRDREVLCAGKGGESRGLIQDCNRARRHKSILFVDLDEFFTPLSSCATQNLSPEYNYLVTTSSVTTLRDLLPTLMDELPQVIDEVVGLLREEWPDYASFLEEDPDGVGETAQAAILHLVALAEAVPAQRDQQSQSSEGTELFEEVGRMEWREGRSLSTLLSAYRAGARVAWRHMSRAALRRGVPPEAIALLAEAVFVFVEELSSASARGYVEEQLATSAERERLRGELADLLLSERADLTVVRTTAAAAGWPLPATSAIVVVDPARSHEFFARLEPTALPLRRAELTGAVLADPDGPGRRARLTVALSGAGAVVGASVPPSQLPTTMRAALLTARLRDENVLAGDPLFVDEHYDALVVHGDAGLLEQLTAQALAPLDGLPVGTRARLEETLTLWLRTMGDRQEVARRLHVHPQTVRYRLGRLHALLGDAMDDPAARLRLTLALCWR